MKYRNKEHLYIVRDDLIVNQGDMTHDEAATWILETNGYNVPEEPYEYFDELSGHNRPLIKWQIARFEDLDVPQKHPFIDLLVENTGNAAWDEGIYFLSKNVNIEGFKTLIEKYKKQT